MGTALCGLHITHGRGDCDPSSGGRLLTFNRQRIPLRVLMGLRLFLDARLQQRPGVAHGVVLLGESVDESLQLRPQFA